MIPKDLVLESERIRLEPLHARHARDLQEAGNDEAVWAKVARSNPLTTLDSTLRYIEDAVQGKSVPDGIPFAVIDRAGAKAIGTTRYFDISANDRKLEIGWTWIGRRYWRTHVNTECKFMLLQYAFEQAGAVRVQLKADSENDRSRAAIARIGATYERTLRNFRVSEASIRSVSFYSILDTEWPAVKERLQTFLFRGNAPLKAS